MSIEWEIPGYGSSKGRESNGIAEFFNIQYGQIAARFEYATLFEGSTNSQHDCTNQGPSCPQEEPFNDNYNGVPVDECVPLDLKYDEFKCLNLRSQVPTICLDLEYPHKIPTVVWSHGGSNIAGSPYRGSSNAQRWLERAVRAGKPFAISTPHYRVGPLGWLPKAGVYNQAIDDQRSAVQWARKFGAAWHGDLEKISLIGQSAGSSDTFAHLKDEKSYSLVRQIGMLSGHIGTGGFVPRASYIDLMNRYEQFSGKSVTEASTEELVNAQSKLGVQVYAAVDPSSPDTDLEGRSNPGWPAFKTVRAIVSDCKEDGAFIVENKGAVESAKQLGVQEDEAAEFYTDLVFRSGSNEVWEAGGSAVSRQICDATNPYTPSWGNNHMVESHYIINGYKTRPEFEEAVAECQKIWTDLVHLESPWDPESQASHLTPSGRPKIVSNEEAHKSRPSKHLNVDPKYDSSMRTIRGW